ncbi:MAG: glutathione S-transferase [Marinibacterium sp.]|nr:glutathione S-transferase [Marinibacterium sp.]
MIRLHNYTLSGSCYKVRLLLGFLEIQHELVAVDFFPGQEHKSVEFSAINPLQQIPVLDDGNLRLRDAQAILAYLARRYDTGRTWLPDDPARFGQVMMWLGFAGTELMAASAARLHDAFGFDLDIDRARSDAHAAFAVLDDHLAERQILGQTWLVGDTPTIADVACFPYVALSGDGGIGQEHYPNLRIWQKAFRRLPRFDAVSGVPEFV